MTEKRIIGVADALLLHPEGSEAIITPHLCLKALRSLDPRGKNSEVAVAVSLLKRYGLVEETSQSGHLLITERGFKWRGNLQAHFEEIEDHKAAAYKADLAASASVELATAQYQSAGKWAKISGICAIISTLAAVVALLKGCLPPGE